MFTNFEIMPSKSKIYFYFDNVSFSLKNRTQLKKFIGSIFGTEKMNLESLTYIFCQDKRILKLNQQFLSHNYYTDIITFDLAEKEKVIIGEVYISIDSVRENAKSFNEPFCRELQRVMFHGALHLCGYADKTKAERTKMKGKEDFYLSKAEEKVSHDNVSS